MTTIEYALAFQFKARWHWHIQDTIKFQNIEDARAELAYEVERAKSTPQGWAKNWKIVSRNITDWKDVK